MSSSLEETAEIIHKRTQCLRRVIDQPLSKRDLVDELNILRSTLDDIIRELEDANLIDYIDGKWQATYPGELAYQAYSEYIELLSSIQESSHVLDVLNKDSKISLDFVSETEVYETESEVLGSVMLKLVDQIEQANHTYVLFPNMVGGHISQLYEKGTIKSEDTLEIIVTPEVLEIWESTSSAILNEMANDNQVRIYYSSNPSPYSICLFDENKAGVVCYTEHGFAGLLLNDTPEALEWARQQYQKTWRRSNSISKFGALMNH